MTYLLMRISSKFSNLGSLRLLATSITRTFYRQPRTGPYYQVPSASFGLRFRERHMPEPPHSIRGKYIPARLPGPAVAWEVTPSLIQDSRAGAFVPPGKASEIIDWVNFKCIIPLSDMLRERYADTSQEQRCTRRSSHQLLISRQNPDASVLLL